MSLQVLSDASSKGWGAAWGNIQTNRRWSATEKLLHINVLELKDAMLGIQSLMKNQHLKIISLNMENSTAVAYVNHTVDPISASLSNILSFLADCFDDGLQYRSINVLRSALSSSYPRIDGYAVGQHSYVLNLMKSIFNNRPPKPRYSYI
jgi:hypothetical protein